jgi:hypothetical protein
LRLHDARQFGGEKNWKQKKKWEQKNIFRAIFFKKQIKFLGARRQHMAKGIGLFFTLSFAAVSTVSI